MHKQGFTLLELIIVLIILSLSISIIIPKLSFNNDKKILKTYATNLCSFLKMARYKSLFLEQPAKIDFDSKNNYFILTISKHKELFKIKDKSIKITLQSPNSFPIYFYPIGTGNSFIIQLQKKHAYIHIKFNAVNGKFTITTQKDHLE